MIAAMAKGKRVLGEPGYLDSPNAPRARADYATPPRRRSLPHGSPRPRAHIPAYLEDYAYLADALVSLYEAGGSAEFLREAATLADRLIGDFGDGDGAFFATAKDHETLVARPREGHDGALPNANAVAARALASLGRHLERPELTSRARAAIDAHGALVARAPRAFATSLAVIDFLEAKPAELAIVGTPGAPDRTALELAAPSITCRTPVAMRSERPSDRRWSPARRSSAAAPPSTSAKTSPAGAGQRSGRRQRGTRHNSEIG